MRFKLGPIDFTQPSTWRGVAGIAALCGISLSPELTNQIAIALGAALSAIELFRNEYAAHSPRPLAGEGPGVRVVDATTDPLTLALTAINLRLRALCCCGPNFGCAALTWIDNLLF